MADKSQTSAPAGYVGAEEHGTTPKPGEGGRPAGRILASQVWNGTPFMVTAEHGDDVTAWNPDCSWYQYGIALGLNGCQHPGMDIGLPRGTRLHAAVGGTAQYAGWDDRFYRPHHVDILGDDGNYYIYAHMWSVDPAVTPGGRVEAGQYLGESGEQTVGGTMNPDGSGAHLHIEVRSGNVAINPNDALVNAPMPGTGGTSPIVSEPFAIGDKIRVADPPLNFRTAAGTGAQIIRALPLDVELCVTGGPTEANGHTWYQVRTVEGGEAGWVAGAFCGLVAKQAC